MRHEFNSYHILGTDIVNAVTLNLDISDDVHNPTHLLLHIFFDENKIDELHPVTYRFNIRTNSEMQKDSNYQLLCEVLRGLNHDN